jgi:hypothetical protein
MCHTVAKLIWNIGRQTILRTEEMMRLSRKPNRQDRQQIAAVPPMESIPSRGRWSTAFLMAGSALLGATAVAFWNRRTLANMRIQILAEAAKPQPRVNMNEEIF